VLPWLHTLQYLQVIRKLSRKVKMSTSKSAVNSAESAIPHTLLEHKNEVKGACLGEGQVGVVIKVSVAH
jgi:hypothetical protein